MQIVRATILGYCMGVRRAVEAAERAAAEHPDKTVYTLGPLIHNKAALDSLSQKGIRVLADDARDMPTDAAYAVVVVRAHGIPPVIMEKLRNSGCSIVDATCPRVLSSQKRAADFARKGYTLILAGDKNHAEVTGISGHVTANGARCIVVESRLDAEKMAPIAEPCVLISQTTISKTEYDDIAHTLLQKAPSLTVCNTICPATRERQDALRELCACVDGVLVIGGKHSANTCRLYRSAQKRCKHAALIETAAEIPREFFALGRVGISAGASTPDFVIDSVEAALMQNGD